MKCGSTEDLEIDHIDPATKVSTINFSWGKKKLASELAKCQTLCKSCHRLKTNQDLKSWRIRKACPSTTAYRAGCRCDGCREAHRLGNQKWLTSRG
ncbi:HNH endonuclease signature motif containing protein [Mycobacteroides franklinii]|uniref:HNH endonuclease signature motif containing protein n=1 Tax=Mycobacteroides franklinii TaxID=948102 RepID=UPI003AF88FB7